MDGLSATELENLAIQQWQACNIVDARKSHWLAREKEPETDWIRYNDYWFYAPDVRVNEDYLINAENSVYKDAKISILMVGYARPEGAMRCATSARLTADRPDLVEIFVVTDESDSLSDRYKNLPEINSFVIPQHKTSEKWNFLYSQCTGDIIVMVADDVVFESRGWDEYLRKSWPDDGVAVMFSDNKSGIELLEFPIISRKMADHLGYAAYPGLQHAGLDTWWEIIGKNLGRLYYLGDVWDLRHHHYETSTVHKRSAREGINVIRDYQQFIDEESGKLKPLMKGI